MTSSPQAPPPDLTVGGYRLLTRIGEGGMGVVHLAQQPGGPRVALKVLRPHVVGGDEARQRLAREVGSLSRVRSPRVAAIVDADPWGDIPFVATRYVPGLSLHDHVREEGPVRGPDLELLAGELAEALSAVHACGVVHRDVKPSNVLLEGRHPVLIDFGLARLADDPQLTQTGWFLGTPGYLAPEILYGEEATAASDVHSWAATVAFAGLGRPPYGRGPGMAIMDRVRRGEHDLTGLPPALRALLADALEPDPGRRPTVRELLAELQPSAGEEWFPFQERPEPPPATMPLAAAARDVEDADTRRTPAPGTTRPAPAAATSREPVHPSYRAVAPSDRPTVGARLRRGSLHALLVLLGAGAVAAAPYLSAGAMLVGAWLLRSGSLAASAAGNRRLLRGRKWYDGAQTLTAAPWHLVQSVPGTLLLGLWSAGLGLAGVLLGYAAALGTAGTLALGGGLFTLALGMGPGGERVRGPVRRPVHAVASRPVLWAVVVLLLGAAAGFAGSVAGTGPVWTPADGAPLPTGAIF